MPAVCQGARLDGGKQPIPNPHTPAAVGDERQRQKLDYLAKLNRKHADARPKRSICRKNPPKRCRSTARIRRRPSLSADSAC